MVNGAPPCEILTIFVKIILVIVSTDSEVHPATWGVRRKLSRCSNLLLASGGSSQNTSKFFDAKIALLI